MDNSIRLESYSDQRVINLQDIVHLWRDQVVGVHLQSSERVASSHVIFYD